MKIDYENVLQNKIGAENGIDEKILRKEIINNKFILDEIQNDRKNGKMKFMNLPYEKGLAGEIKKLAEEKARNFDNLVVVGMGGSSLGSRAMHSALNYSYYNLFSKEGRNGYPRIFIADNIDPERIKRLLEFLNPTKTLFNIITKSGQTHETIANFLVFLDFLKKALGKDYKENIIAITDKTKGFLREISEVEGFTSFDIPKDVTGRFSVFTPCGLVPAAFVGIDIIELLEGARHMDEYLKNSQPEENYSYILALIHFILYTQKGKTIFVMMPYSDILRDLAFWARQLWAESLGKRYNLNNEVVQTGQTPLVAVGAIDQHSQIQLYIEGPNDKLIAFWEIEKFRDNIKIPILFPERENISYLQGKSLEILLKTEKMATVQALTKVNRPNYTIFLPEVSSFTIGRFLFFLEMQTIYAAKLYNINPFDQPGVGMGKTITYQLLQEYS